MIDRSAVNLGVNELTDLPQESFEKLLGFNKELHTAMHDAARTQVAFSVCFLQG